MTTLLTDTRVSAIRPPAEGQAEYPDAKVTGLRLRVGKSGAKTWILRRRIGAKLMNRKLGTYPALTLASARDAALSLLESIETTGDTASADRTFAELVEAWLEMKRGARKRNKSVELQRRRLELHVLPAWGARRIAEIRRADVRDLIEGLEGDVLPNRVLTIVKTLFRYALSRDWIEASPVEGIKKPQDESPRDRWLDMAECVRVWEASDLLAYPFRHLVRMLLLTGQRRTEVASMQWDHLDLEAGTWTLKAGDVKGDRAHLVPLSAPALAILRAVPRFGPYVFTTDGRTHISGFAKGKAALDTYISGLGGPLAPWTLHDLRRTCNSHMARLGIGKDIRARVLNHAPEGVTDVVYTVYDFQSEKRAALDRWAADLMRAVAGEPESKIVELRKVQ